MDRAPGSLCPNVYFIDRVSVCCYDLFQEQHMPQVIIEQPGIPPMTVPLSGGEVTFGRAEENDVVLVADEVSRQHARLFLRGNVTVLRDLKSLNGTYVNRQRVSERVLKHMDEIWFGSKCRLVFRDDTVQARGADRAAFAAEDSQLLKSINSIRAEMDRVGSNMTLIGRRGSEGAAAPRVETPAPTGEELVRIGRAYRRLAALHRANQVMTSNFDLAKRLANMLDTIIEVVEADRGFVLLSDGRSKTLRVKVAREMGRELEAASPSMGIAGQAAMDGEAVLMADRSDREFGNRESIVRGRIVSAMCVPLKVEDRILGSVYVDTRKPGMHFSEEDLELFSSLASQSAMAIDNARLADQIVESEKRRQNLARFLPNALVDKVLNESQTLVLGGHKTRVTSMFCDIRGSSKLAEQLAPQQLVGLLNEHFSAMTEIVFKYEGTLDKYIGDEIMAIFGAPISIGDEPYRAVCTALEMQQCNEELNVLRAHENRPQFHIGTGIDCGEVIAGYIGSPKRMDFTVVGDRVNTAKRLCDMAASGKILIGREVYDAVKDRVEAVPMGHQSVKGKDKTVEVYEVTSLKH